MRSEQELTTRASAVARAEPSHKGPSRFGAAGCGGTTEFPAAACCPRLDCASSAERTGGPGPSREPPVTGHSTENFRMLIPTPTCAPFSQGGESPCKSVGVSHELEDLCLTSKSNQDPTPALSSVLGDME